MPNWKPLLAAVLLLAPLAAAQPGHPAPQDRNAALVYWPAWTMIADETAKKVADVDWDKPGVPREVADLLGPQEGDSISLMIEGSRLKRCDFEVQYEKGIDALLPHLGLARKGARVLRAAARVQAAAGDTGAAAVRLATIYRMAEHVSHDDILISSLVSMAMAAAANADAKALAASGTLTAAGRDELVSAISRLQGADPFRARASIAGERDLMIPWVKRLKGTNAGDELAARVRSGMQVDQPQTAALRGLSGEALTNLTEGLSRYYDDATVAWDDKDPVNKLNTLAKDVGKEYGALAVVLAPALGGARASDLKAQADLAETLAAVKGAKVK
ncbi:MAG: hypothetical protein IT437_01780 [Phycisphaerales bacterium]|nr:hypothetical protein [Phycisphaerales bacterium]